MMSDWIIYIFNLSNPPNITTIAPRPVKWNVKDGIPLMICIPVNGPSVKCRDITLSLSLSGLLMNWWSRTSEKLISIVTASEFYLCCPYNVSTVVWTGGTTGVLWGRITRLPLCLMCDLITKLLIETWPKSYICHIYNVELLC